MAAEVQVLWPEDGAGGAGDPWAGQAGSADWPAGVVRVLLRHDGRLNAMSRAMWRQLRQVFLALQADTRARCVLLSGVDGAFCAGGDISEYPGFRFDAVQLRAFHEDEVWGALSALLACDLPLVAAIAGPCMGAGVEIASCCDLRIAAADARFGAPIARLGFPMAPREAALVARALGQGVARQMLLEAATFDAAELAGQGFVSRVVPAGQAHRQALDSARRIAALAPAAARMNKQTLRAISQASEGKMAFPGVCQGDAAIDSIAIKELPDPYAYADSAEHREGISAFLEKRHPRF
ncbi:enoyl-CoA hydratase-related protein [Melaminivora sp.]